MTVSLYITSRLRQGAAASLPLTGRGYWIGLELGGMTVSLYITSRLRQGAAASLPPRWQHCTTQTRLRLIYRETVILPDQLSFHQLSWKRDLWKT